ncbi:MAG TPA: hypothetical protein VF668_10375 [Pyrinomonadaceae bacterium]|jgi:hypothetical protein
MTAALSLDAGRRAAVGGEELRRRVLALVLAFVLVWHTFVVPASPAARSHRSLTPDDGGHDGEVRGPAARPAARKPAEDLDWPEYIYP